MSSIESTLIFSMNAPRPPPPLSDRPADDSFSRGQCLGKPLILVPGLDRPEMGRPLQPLPEPRKIPFLNCGGLHMLSAIVEINTSRALQFRPLLPTTRRSSVIFLIIRSFSRSSLGLNVHIRCFLFIARSIDAIQAVCMSSSQA